MSEGSQAPEAERDTKSPDAELKASPGPKESD
jgi:hypothetical protein